MNNTGEKSGIYNMIKPAIVLVVITIITAAVLSALNLVTKSEIERQLLEEKMVVIREIFGDGIDAPSELDYAISEPVNEIMLVTRGGVAEGFCVDVTSTGFGGEMRILVGVNIDNTVRGVRVYSASETAGIGTKVQGEDFLSRFDGLVEGISAGGGENGVDTISGATISSKAVIKGVNEALGQTMGIDIGTFVVPSHSDPSEDVPTEEQTTSEERTEPSQEQTTEELGDAPAPTPQ